MVRLKRRILHAMLPSSVSLDRTDKAVFGIIAMFYALAVLVALLFVGSRFGFSAEIDACGRANVADPSLSIMQVSLALMMGCAPFSWVMLASRFNCLTLLFVMTTGLLVVVVHVSSTIIIGLGCFSDSSRTF